MTNEEKYKTAEEREKVFQAFCNSNACYKCKYGGKNRHTMYCQFDWLADEYKDTKQDLPFMVKTEVRNGCEVRSICSFDGKEVISCWDVIAHYKAYCDSLNSAALAWHKRMMEKEGK